MKLLFKSYDGEETKDTGELAIVDNQLVGPENLLFIIKDIIVTNGTKVFTTNDKDKYLEQLAREYRTPYLWAEIRE